MISNKSYRPVYETEILSYHLSKAFFSQVLNHHPIYLWAKKEIGDDRSISLFFIMHVKYKIYSYVWDYLKEDLYDKNLKWNYESFNVSKLKLTDYEINYISSILVNPFRNKDKGEHYFNVIMDNIKPIQNKSKVLVYKNIYKLINLFNKKLSFDNQKKVAIFYSEGLNPHYRNDNFWVDSSEIPKKNIIVLIPKYEIVNKEYILKHIKNMGYTYRFVGNFIGNSQECFDLLLNNYFLKNHTYKILNKLDRWLFDLCSNYLKNVAAWKELFIQHNIKIIYDITERDLTTIYRRDAINKLGGVLLGHVRSHNFAPKNSITGQHPKDYIFSWNNNSIDKISFLNDGIIKIIKIGYPYPLIKKIHIDKDNFLQKLTKNLKNNNISIILFDNGFSGKNNAITKQMLYDFYDKFLKLCEEEEIYLIIKSKKNTLKNFNTKIKNRITILEKRNKLNFIDGYKNSFFYAQYSDLAIGLGGYSTSISECVIGGLRGIYLDMINLPYLELYKYGKNRIIFDSIEKLINEIILAKQKNNLGDLGKWTKKEKHLIDIYRDGYGYKRIGNFIKNLYKNI